jgi:hypothetical protein
MLRHWETMSSHRCQREKVTGKTSMKIETILENIIRFILRHE